jgi:hypothetical protein
MTVSRRKLLSVISAGLTLLLTACAEPVDTEETEVTETVSPISWW